MNAEALYAMTLQDTMALNTTALQYYAALNAYTSLESTPYGLHATALNATALNTTALQDAITALQDGTALNAMALYNVRP